MRASRLVTLLFTMQRCRRARAAELAEELEVSERTIYRRREDVCERVIDPLGLVVRAAPGTRCRGRGSGS